MAWSLAQVLLLVLMKQQAVHSISQRSLTHTPALLLFVLCSRASHKVNCRGDLCRNTSPHTELNLNSCWAPSWLAHGPNRTKLSTLAKGNVMGSGAELQKDHFDTASMLVLKCEQQSRNNNSLEDTPNFWYSAIVSSRTISHRLRLGMLNQRTEQNRQHVKPLV